MILSLQATAKSVILTAIHDHRRDDLMGFDTVDESKPGECACGSASYCIDTAISLLRCDPATPLKEKLLNYHQAIWFLQRECSHLRRQITQSELLNDHDQEPGEEI